MKKKLFIFLILFLCPTIVYAENNCVVNPIEDQIYTGKEIKPNVTVTCDENILTEETDYTVLYKNNKKVGTATVDITGTENYDDLELSTNFNIVYSITYELNGGVNGANPATYNGKTTITLKDATKEGYTFGGWYAEKTFKTKVTTIKKGSTGNKTLYAKWTVNKYNVKFKANGGTGTTKELTNVKYNKSVKLTKNGFTRSGYKFVEWNTKKNGTGIAYANQASVKNLTSKSNGKVTLYAQWNIIRYTLKYNLDGGTISETANPTEYYVNTADIKLKNPTKVGFAFGGWYAEKTFKTKVTTIKKGSTGNKTLYAKWTPITYKVKFNANGGTGTTKELSSVAYNKSVKLTKNAFTRKGYKFIGWNTKKDGSGVSYKDKVSIKNLTTKNKSTLTLYAQWKIIDYKVTYNLNGGVNNEQNPATFDVNTAFKFKAPTKVGYTFKGFYTDKKFKTKITEIKKGTAKNITVYAKWDIITYSIKYVLNGGTNSTKNPTSYKVNTATIVLQNPTKKGYTFDGWYLEPEFENKIETINKGSSTNYTLYAKWTPIKYNIVFNGNYNDNDAIVEGIEDAVYDVNYVLPENTFTRGTHLAAGWNTKADGTGTTYTAGQSIKNLSSTEGATVVLYSNWKLNDIPVISELKKVSYKKQYVKVTGSDETRTYAIYRSTDNKTFKEIGTITLSGSSTTGYYYDSNIKQKTVYYYKVRAFVTENGTRIYSDYSSTSKITSAEKPNIVPKIVSVNRQNSYYIGLSINNKGSKKLYVGGDNVRNFALIQPYSNGITSNGFLAKEPYGSIYDSLYINPKKTGIVYFRIGTRTYTYSGWSYSFGSRYLSDGKIVTTYFYYDDCIYIVGVGDAGVYRVVPEDEA